MMRIQPDVNKERATELLEICFDAFCRYGLEGTSLKMLSEAGGMNGFVRPGHREPGYFRDLSVPVKEVVPVLLTGGVTTPDQAEALLEEGYADLIGAGRAIYKNAHWADET